MVPVSEWFRNIVTAAALSGRRLERRRERNRAEAAAAEARRLAAEGNSAPRRATANDVQYPSASFSGQVQRAAINEMTILLSVWRVGSQMTEEYEVGASRILAPGKEAEAHLAKNYSFELFTEAFERKMHKKKPREGSDIKFGRLSYFHRNGDAKTVEDQESFEVGIGHLYLSRANGDVLRFLFQAESLDQRAEREAAEQAEAQRLAAAHQEEDLDTAGNQVAGGKSSISSTSEAASQTVGHSQSDPDSPISPHTIKISKSRSPEKSSIRSNPRGSAKGSVDPQETLLEASEDDDGQSSSIGHKIINSLSLALTTSNNRKEKSKREPWNEHEDFKSKFVIKEIVAYKRGGDDEADEADVADFKAADKAVDDGDIEVLEDAEDESEIVAAEDRVVAK